MFTDRPLVFNWDFNITVHIILGANKFIDDNNHSVEALGRNKENIICDRTPFVIFVYSIVYEHNYYRTTSINWKVIHCTIFPSQLGYDSKFNINSMVMSGYRKWS